MATAFVRCSVIDCTQPRLVWFHAIIESVDVEPAPLRMVLGSQALDNTIATLGKRIAGFEAQSELAASTDFPPGE